jgi:hypothetical protein
MTAFQLYCILKLDDILGGCLVIALILLVPMLLWCISKIDSSLPGGELSKSMRWILPIEVICTLLCIFVPDTKQMGIIIVVPKITTAIGSNQQMMELPGQLTDLAAQWIVKLKPDTENHAR